MVEFDRLRVEYESLQKKTEREQIVRCQNVAANPNNTAIGNCTCNENNDLCDASCCCDSDCSEQEIKALNCLVLEPRENINSIPSKSSAQSKCYGNVPIFKSNSPNLIEKQDDLLCIYDQQNIDSDNAYYRQINQKLDSFIAPRSINIDTSVTSPLGTPTELTDYQVGTSVFRYIPTTNTATYFSLPIKLFNSELCSGLQPITYMNDFTSTCNQPLNNQTCLNALNGDKYINSFSLVTNPSTLANNLTSIICTVSGGSAASWSNLTCSNALQILTVTIFYTNPTGIQNCTVLLSVNQANSSPVKQTFNVRFVRSGSPSLTSASRSGNPGYSTRAPIIAGTSNGISISTFTFSVLQPSIIGDCSGTPRIPIRFGENIQSTCEFSPASFCPNQAELSSIFLSFTSFNIYVAAYGNSDPSNITGNWLPVTYCVYDIGSSNEPVCLSGSRPDPSGNECYTRMDIQIAYANIGSVSNPQPILGAVIFHYQRINITNTTTLTKPLLITQTVTFQDLSNAPVTEGDQLPKPNVRLPGDFFYPFTLNRANVAISFSSFCYFLIMFVLTLM
ncbi:unnamed protein product [Rotaria socialis]|uniref:Tectonic-1-3 domain-containing protein n=1 Tax=Rotaria socialis TaxID=392032 RepID=A0A820VKY3_9BILA|nr:unnamed protein product [Rotaria socialis]